MALFLCSMLAIEHSATIAYVVLNEEASLNAAEVAVTVAQFVTTINNAINFFVFLTFYKMFKKV